MTPELPIPEPEEAGENPLLSLLPLLQGEDSEQGEKSKGVEALFNWLLPYAMGVGRREGEIDPKALTLGKTFKF